MNFNLQAPIFQDAPVPPKIGIPLRLYDQYILKCLASGVSVTEIFAQLQAIGYLQKYSTFAQFVSKKVLQKVTRSVDSSYKKTGLDINKPEVTKSLKADLSDLQASNPALTALLNRKKQFS